MKYYVYICKVKTERRIRSKVDSIFITGKFHENTFQLHRCMVLKPIIAIGIENCVRKKKKKQNHDIITFHINVWIALVLDQIKNNLIHRRSIFKDESIFV